MFQRVMRRGWAAVGAAVLVAAAAVLWPAGPAMAHCDNVNGPVVAAARQALEEGDVKRVLPYVKADAEAELTRAYAEAMAVRKLGGQAAELATRYFFETAVRLHREGEGAAYTGLKYEDDYGPALHAAEQVVAGASPEKAVGVLEEALHRGVEERYHAMLEARERAAREGTVAADRERAEAELGFELYVYGVYEAAMGHSGHSEGGGEAGEGGGGGHSHGHDAGESISVEVNGRLLPGSGALAGDEVMVPLRAVAEAVGAEVTWDGASLTASVRLGVHSLQVRAGQHEAVVNGRHLAMPVAAELHDGRLYLPAHLLAEALDLHLTREGHLLRFHTQ